jgi:glutathione reductase (NADPH)
MAFDFDLFVIGGGSGGVRSGRLAAAAGYKVGLAEEFRMGGTCVIRGCVPKKLMVYASGFSEAFEDAEGFGWTVGERSFDWAKLIAAKDKEITRLEAAYSRNLGSSGATQFDARAELVDAQTVQLSTGEKFTAKHILIAVGGTPFVPPIEGAEYAITSNDIFDLAEMPARTLVVGGGYIASEFAGILNGLGSKVTQFYRGDQILRGFAQ